MTDQERKEGEQQQTNWATVATTVTIILIGTPAVLWVVIKITQVLSAMKNM